MAYATKPDPSFALRSVFRYIRRITHYSENVYLTMYPFPNFICCKEALLIT